MKNQERSAISVPTCLGPLRGWSAGAGEPVVLWHSLFIDRRSFDAVGQALAQDHRVVAIDGPGHGQSPGPDRLFDLEECATAATELMDALQLDRPHWIGNAWGGHVGVVLAARSPTRLRSLVAMCSPMQALEARTKAHLLVTLYRLLGARGPVRSGLIDSLLHPDRRRESADLERYLVSCIDLEDRRPMVLAMRSVMLGRPSLVDRLSAIEVPTLFASSGSELWSEATARAQLDRIPRGRFVGLTGVRHLPPLEDPDGTTTLLRAWLGEHATA